MRICCPSLLPLLLVCCPVLAGAATIRTGDPNFTYVSSTPDSFSFSVCPTASSPGGPYEDHNVPVTGDGCFGGINSSGAAITEIDLTFQNTAAIQNSGPAVAESDLFSDAYVISPADPTNANEFYTYVYKGSELADGVPFVIVEDGITDPSQFPTVTLTYTTVTPEPSSLLLLSSGLACVAFVYRRRVCS